MEIITGFFASQLGIAALSVAAGVVVAAAAYFSRKIGRLPALEQIKDKYPVLDLVLNIAANQLSSTRYGFLFDAAVQIWQSEGFDADEAARYAEAMVANFDLDKYLGTDWDALSEEQIAQGKQIAAALGLNA